MNLNPELIRNYRRWFLAVLFVLLITLAVGCSRNNGGGITSGTGGGPPASSPSSPEVSNSGQVIAIVTSSTEIAHGASGRAVVKLSISPGYHINANPATYPYLIATQITPGKVDGITADKPVYPAAKTQKFQFADDPLAVYEGEIQLQLPLKADAKAAGERSLPISIRVQACDTEKCFPPATLNSTIPITVK